MSLASRLDALPRVSATPPRRLLAGLRWVVVGAASLLELRAGVASPGELRNALVLGMLLAQQTFTFWLAGRDLAPKWSQTLLLVDLGFVLAATVACGPDASNFFLLFPLLLVEATVVLKSKRAYAYAALMSILYVAARLVVTCWMNIEWTVHDFVLLGLEIGLFGIVTSVSLHIMAVWMARIEQISRLSLLDDLSLLLADTRQLDDVLASFVELVPPALNVQACVIAIDEPGSERRIWANLGADTSALIDEALLDRGLSLRSGTTGSQSIVRLAGHDAPYAVVSMLPLEIDDRAVGLLSVARVTPEPFELSDSRLLESLGRHAAQALRNARLYRLEAEEARRSRDLDHLKSEMLAGVSHEFRLPLTSISLSVETLIGQHDGLAAHETTLRLLRNIQRSANRLSGFVQDLLDLARIDANQLELRAGPCDLVLLARAALANLEPLCELKGQRLRFEPAQDRCVVEGDAKRLEQVVSNLLTNAHQYTPEGGEIVLTLAPALSPRIDGHAGLLAEEPAVVIGVRDSGPGIPPEEREHIFDRFGRGAAGRLRSTGAGLGLYIARSVVELHGGRIWVGDNGSGGSTFWCLLPCVAPFARLQEEQSTLTVPAALPLD